MLEYSRDEFASEDDFRSTVAEYQRIYSIFEWESPQISRMDPEEKAKLIAALRSGDYKQTTNKLKGRPVVNSDDAGLTDIGYCCLGVATDLKVREGIGYWNEKGYYCYDEYYQTDSILGPHLTAILKLTTVGVFAEWKESSPKKEQYGDRTFICYDLALLNDSGFTFNQIADVIDYFL
jgi:hypothetical protein